MKTTAATTAQAVASGDATSHTTLYIIFAILGMILAIVYLLHSAGVIDITTLWKKKEKKEEKPKEGEDPHKKEEHGKHGHDTPKKKKSYRWLFIFPFIITQVLWNVLMYKYSHGFFWHNWWSPASFWWLTNLGYFVTALLIVMRIPGNVFYWILLWFIMLYTIFVCANMWWMFKTTEKKAPVILPPTTTKIWITDQSKDIRLSKSFSIKDTGRYAGPIDVRFPRGEHYRMGPNVTDQKVPIPTPGYYSFKSEIPGKKYQITITDYHIEE